MRGFFGDGIADRLMIPYARKLWTVEPSTMDFDWIGRRVPTPEVDRILNGALTDDVQQVGATAHFWYPWRGGIEAMASALADRVESIELGCEVRAIDLDRRASRSKGERRSPSIELIFTLPLASLPRFIENLPSDIASACARLAVPGDSQHQSRRRPSGSFAVPLGLFLRRRVSLPSRLVSGELQPAQRSAREELDRDRSRVCSRASRQISSAPFEGTIEALRSAKILDDDDRVELVHAEAIAPAYVIYDLDHAAAVETVVSWLRAQGIRAAGRVWRVAVLQHGSCDEERSTRSRGDTRRATRRGRGSGRAGENPAGSLRAASRPPLAGAVGAEPPRASREHRTAAAAASRAARCSVATRAARPGTREPRIRLRRGDCGEVAASRCRGGDSGPVAARLCPRQSSRGSQSTSFPPRLRIRWSPRSSSSGRSACSSASFEITTSTLSASISADELTVRSPRSVAARRATSLTSMPILARAESCWRSAPVPQPKSTTTSVGRSSCSNLCRSSRPPSSPTDRW